MSRHNEYYENAYENVRSDYGDTDYAAEEARRIADQQVQRDRELEDAHREWQDDMRHNETRYMKGGSGNNGRRRYGYRPSYSYQNTEVSWGAVVALGVVCVGLEVTNFFWKKKEKEKKSSLQTSMGELAKAMEERRKGKNQSKRRR